MLPATGTEVDRAPRVKRHLRACKISEDGIATIKVTLEGLRLTRPVVIAALSLPYCDAHFPEEAIADGKHKLTVSRPSNLSRGLKIAILQTGAKVDWESVVWTFEVSNAVPLSTRDAQVPFKGYWQRGEEELATAELFASQQIYRLTRCQVLRIETEELVMSMTVPEKRVGTSEFIGVGEAFVPRAYGIGRDWTADGRAHLVHKTLDPKKSLVTATMTVPNPQNDHRYGVCLETACPAEQLTDFEIAQKICDHATEQEPNDQSLSCQLQRFLEEDLRGYMEQQGYPRATDVALRSQ